ncbi:unnamed protein product [Amoebophrya sp. A120]|nr:unnamed protein product [Amoebophrya sp. A120]|eukprot:GSA120T00003504001.1
MQYVAAAGALAFVVLTSRKKDVRLVTNGEFTFWANYEATGGRDVVEAVRKFLRRLNENVAHPFRACAFLVGSRCKNVCVPDSDADVKIQFQGSGYRGTVGKEIDRSTWESFGHYLGQEFNTFWTTKVRQAKDGCIYVVDFEYNGVRLSIDVGPMCASFLPSDWSTTRTSYTGEKQAAIRGIKKHREFRGSGIDAERCINQVASCYIDDALGLYMKGCRLLDLSPEFERA